MSSAIILRGARPLLAVVVVGSLLGARSTPAAPDLPTQCVVGVRAVRGFQGLFEWMPGDTNGVPSRILGGPWESNGTLLDLPGIAKEAGITPTMPLHPDDVFVLTTLRNVHAATEVWVRGIAITEAPLSAVTEQPAEVVATDPALDLALLRCRQPAGSFRFAPGLLFDSAPIAPGRPVDRVEFWSWSVYRNPDVLRARGMLGPGDDAFFQPGVMILWSQQGGNANQIGDPLVDRTSGRLLAMLASGTRQVKAEGGGDEWPGPAFAIDALRLRSFVVDWLAGRAPHHGSATDFSIQSVVIDPAIAALRDLPEARGLLVLTDWPATSPVFLRGDILLQASGHALGAGGSSLTEVAFDSEPGSTLSINLVRAGVNRTLDLPVRPLRRASAATVSAMNFGGAWFQDLDATFRQDGDDEDGVIVADVQPGSPAEAADLRFRMVVHRVASGGRSIAVHDVKDLAAALRDLCAPDAFTGELGLLVRDLRHPASVVQLAVLRMRPDEARNEVAR